LRPKPGFGLGWKKFLSTGNHMKKSRSENWAARGIVIALCLAAAAGCSRDPARSRPDALVALVGAPQSCDLVPADPGRLQGAYLRSTGDLQNLEILRIEGGEGKDALAAALRINELGVRRPLTGELGTLINSRRATAREITALPNTELGPKAYVLEYESDGLSYVGPVVVGVPPIGATLPVGGGAVFQGQVAMIIQNGQSTLEVISPSLLRLGYGSGAAQLEIRIDDANAIELLGFSDLEWSGLGICGQRLVSTGTGQLSTRSQTGSLAVPFRDVAAAATLRPQLEATLYADRGAGQPGPLWVGGVFVIASDQASIRAVFLMAAQN